MESSTATSKITKPFWQFGTYEMVSSVVLVGPWILGLVLLAIQWPLQPTSLGEGFLDVGVALAMYGFTAPGITVGFHRYLTHRSFKTGRFMRILLASAGSMAIEGPPITWVANHNKHHTYADEEGDPHSPHVGHGNNLWRGLYWAHFAWMFRTPTADKKRFAGELRKDPDIVRVNRLFPLFALASLFVIPFAIGWTVTGNLGGAFRLFFWAGIVRMVLVHHITWSVNSACHTWGVRIFKSRDGDGREADHSTNVKWLRWPTLGESNHNNHHAFPRSAIHGLFKGESDLSGSLIRFLKKVGLVWDVVEPTQKEIDEKLINPI